MADAGSFGSLEGDEFAGGDTRGGAEGGVAQPCFGDDGVLVIAEQGLHVGHAGRESRGGFADDRRGRFGGVPAALRSDPNLV